ncbi:hypothetical protein C8J56DRAFT_899830 [Mycena floridula]|nr:hypothetical protein C8J56DRAFT_899830 [Mycena floridula]
MNQKQVSAEPDSRIQYNKEKSDGARTADRLRFSAREKRKARTSVSSEQKLVVTLAWLGVGNHWSHGITMYNERRTPSTRGGKKLLFSPRLSKGFFTDSGSLKLPLSTMDHLGQRATASSARVATISQRKQRGVLQSNEKNPSITLAKDDGTARASARGRSIDNLRLQQNYNKESKESKDKFLKHQEACEEHCQKKEEASEVARASSAQLKYLHWSGLIALSDTIKTLSAQLCPLEEADQARSAERLEKHKLRSLKPSAEKDLEAHAAHYRT